jgi:hypothetical protein
MRNGLISAVIAVPLVYFVAEAVGYEGMGGAVFGCFLAMALFTGLGVRTAVDGLLGDS